jgi:hypothetical protein
MIRKARAFVLAAGLALLGTGCITMGRAFDTRLVPQLVIGKTTQADIQKQFGEPYRTGLENGDLTWTYLRYHFSVFGPQSTTDLYLRFNADHTLKSYALNSNVPEDQLK